MMKIFEHSFVGKTFRLVRKASQLNCLLDFKIFDNETVSVKSLDVPVYRQRLQQLIEDLKIPKQKDVIYNHQFMPPFNFGHHNRSYLLFNIQLIMDRGILMGCV